MMRRDVREKKTVIRIASETPVDWHSLNVTCATACEARNQGQAPEEESRAQPNRNRVVEAHITCQAQSRHETRGQEYCKSELCDDGEQFQAKTKARSDF
jgi:hypothetical protein